MKAAVLEELNKMVVKEVPEPEVGKGDVLVRIKACAICGSEIRTFHYGHKLVAPPRIIGHEMAGIITRAGGEVKGFKEGDRVTVATSVPCLTCDTCNRGYFNLCDNLTGVGFNYGGGFAEYSVIPEPVLRANNLLKLPDNLSFEYASISEPLACCINGQELSGVKKGDTVVIIGAGPIGCMNIAMARARGANKIIVCQRSEARLNIARRFGADHYINSGNTDPIKEVTDITNGRGADVVIVAAPSGEAQEQALHMAAKRGRVNLFGGLPRSKPTITFDSNLVHYKEIFVHGAYGSTAGQHQEALNLLSSGRIDAKSFISGTVSLDRILEGFKMAEEGKLLKIVVLP